MNEEDYWIRHTDDLEAITKQLERLNRKLDDLIRAILDTARR